MNGGKRKLSEEKYEDKVINLLKMIAEQTKPVKVEAQKEVPKSESSEAKSQPKLEEPHEHWKAEDYLKSAEEGCPTCKKEIEKIGKDYMKKAAVESKDLDYECIGCGTHFEKGKKACPNCGKTNVRSI
jgi:hypothetical protein